MAETSAFVTDHYRVWAKPSTTCGQQQQQQQQHHPPFVADDYSWYRTLEDWINDNLDRWAENAQQRRHQRRQNAQQLFQRGLDRVQAPLAHGFGVVTARVRPIVERLRTTVKLFWKQPKNTPLPSDQDHTVQNTTRTTKAALPEGGSENEEPAIASSSKEDASDPPLTNRTDPEDLLILVNDGRSLLYLQAVHPVDRLLALPVVSTIDGKTKPPYRLRLARGGLVITVSVIALGALAPTYRSLRFILEYPKTAELVLGTLVASVAYNIWTWHFNARTRQQERIAVAIQSRFVARDDAALSFLTVGAVQTLTDRVMESYVSRLLSSDGETPLPDMDPLVLEIGETVGLFRWPERTDVANTSTLNQNDIVAVQWEEARTALVHCLAVRM